MILGLRTAIESMLIFSAPAFSTPYMSSTERIPPPTVNGTKTCFATRADRVEVDAAPLRARGDVVEDDLVDLVVVELCRELLGGGDVDVVLELLRLGDAAVDHVEARDEPLRQHVPSQDANDSRIVSPTGPLFSAWNCVATTLSRPTIEQNSTPYSVSPITSPGSAGAA